MSETKKKEQISLEIIKDKICNKSCAEIFDIFFFSIMMSFHFLANKRIYVSSKKSSSQAFMRRYIGILLLMGYKFLPKKNGLVSRQLYFDTTYHATINVTFAVPKYKTECTIHLTDNVQIKNNDKLSKVRPYTDHLNKRFKQFKTFLHDLSICE